MRVLQVVALVDAEGAYGGPTSVAFDHCAALFDAGHDVTLLAGWDGQHRPAVSFNLRLFKARTVVPRRLATLYSIRALLWAARNLRKYDIVHVHLARDLLTLPVALTAAFTGRRLILQTHGMVMPDRRLGARFIDALATAYVFRRAARVLFLTDREYDGLVTMRVGSGKLVMVGNGVSVPAERAALNGDDPKVVFVSRLAERKRPLH